MSTLPASVVVKVLAGQAHTVKVEKGLHYTVRKPGNAAAAAELQIPDNVIASRAGDGLQVRYADGSSVYFEDFYTQCQDASPCSVTLAGDDQAGTALSAASPWAMAGGPESGCVVYAHGEHDVLMSMAHGQADLLNFCASTDAPLQAGIGWGSLAPIAGLGGLLTTCSTAAERPNGRPTNQLSPSPAPSMVQGVVIAGPVTPGNDLEVQLYAADGATLLLNHVEVDSSGHFQAELGSYSGVVFARLVNQGRASDYLDEASNTAKDLNAALQAVGLVSSPGATLHLNLNALSTLAVAQLGADHSSSRVEAVNAGVAQAFGLNNLHLTTVLATNGGSYNPSDGLSEGENYGAVLASLSGMDKLNGGNAQATLDQLSAELSLASASLSASGKYALMAGAKTVFAFTANQTELGSGSTPFGDAVAGLIRYSADPVTQALGLANIGSNAGSGAGSTGGTPEPSLFDYANANIANIDQANKLQLINDVVRGKTLTEVDSQPELQTLADAVGAVINAAAGATPPLLEQLQSLGVTGLSPDNLGSVNQSIAASADDGSGVDTLAELQAMVDAYNAIIPEANGPAPDATPNRNPTAQQYADVGADIGEASGKAENLALLNDIVGGQFASGVDSPAELHELARIANAIQRSAAGGTPSPALTPADFALIGITLGNPDNLALLLDGIAAQADDGSATDSLAKLQALVDLAAPAAPQLNAIGGNNLVNLAQAAAGFAISGSGEPGALLTLVFGGSALTLAGGNSVRVGADGTWALQVNAADAAALGDGLKIVSASSATDFITNTAAQTISGTLSANLLAGETVYVSLNNGSTWLAATATVGANTWSLAGQTLTGSDTLKVKVTDIAGNDGTVLSQSYVLDSTPPVAATFSFSNAGSIASGTVTTGTVTLGLAGDAVNWSYSIDGGTSFSAGSANSFAITGSFAASAIQVRSFDVAGNASTASYATAVLVNHAPALNASQSPSLGSIDTGVTLSLPTGAVGSLVSTLVGSSGIANFSDTEAGTSAGLVVTGYDSTKGTLYYSLDNGSNWATWTPTGSLGLHLLANSSTRLYFNPVPLVGGDPAIAFRAWDRSDTSVANGASLAVSTTGGSTAYSTVSDTISYTLNGAYVPLASSIAAVGSEPASSLIANFNGDGFMDLATSNTTGNAAELVRLGSATGASATTIDSGAEVAGTLPQGAGSNRSESALDFNGDGFVDLAAGDTSGNREIIFGNSTGTVTGGAVGASWTLQSLTQAFHVAKGAGDYNGDGFQDLFTAMDTSGYAGLVYGNAAKTFTYTAQTASIGVTFSTTAAAAGFGSAGSAIASYSGAGISFVGDMNRDGLADIAFSNRATGTVFVKFGTATKVATQLIDATNVGFASGKGFVVSGLNTSSVTATFGGLQSTVGLNLASAGDMNGDGYTDLLILSPGDSSAYVVYGNATADVNVASMTSAKGFKISVTNSAWNFGWNGAGIGDVDGDGYDDIVVGEPDRINEGGAVVVFGGATASHGNINADSVLTSSGWATTLNFTGMTYDGTNLLDGMGNGIGSSAGDVNGDGLSDFSISGSVNQSRPFVVYGKADLNTLGSAPTAGSTQTGTAAADHFVGTVGNDTLTGGGGADVMYGGAGNDLVSVSDTNFLRVDGGLGVDTLKLADTGASGFDLNFSLSGMGGRIRGIENINMMGAGANTLTLTLQDILNQPNAADTSLSSLNEAHLMVISGGTNDHLTFTGGGTWTNIGIVQSVASRSALLAAGYDVVAGEGYNVFTLAGATLIIDSSIIRTGI